MFLPGLGLRMLCVFLTREKNDRSFLISITGYFRNKMVEMEEDTQLGLESDEDFGDLSDGEVRTVV